MSKNTKNSLILYGIISFSLVYYELLFKMRVMMLHFDLSLLRIFLFGFAYSIVIVFFLKFFKRKSAIYIFYIVSSIVVFLYFNQEIYESWFGGFFSINVANSTKEGLSFLGDYFESLKFGQLLYFIPIVAVIVSHKYKIINFSIEYVGLKQPLLLLIAFVVLFSGTIATISQEVVEGVSEDIAYSDRDLYTYIYSSQSAVKEFGLLTYTYRDTMNLFLKDQLSRSEYEVLVDNYIENQPQHVNNTYKNLFLNKNFILIMAESLDTFAINEELTPNLYYLKENYAYFNNYYSPLHYRSTADTEFMVQTSMYPDNNVALSMESYIDNTFPYTLPRLFEDRAYSTYSFHNYTDYFYPRTEFHTNTLGYDEYYGSEELGLLDNPPENAIINTHIWQSDLEMMEIAVPKFINDDKFFVNMLTVSGHFRYNSNHSIGKLHEQEVLDYEIRNDIELPNEIFWYLAANIELDMAIGYLLDELESSGKMDDTVIMIFGDHYAYGVDEDVIWEYDDIKEDYNEMDLNNVPLIIVSDSFMMDQPMDQYMSSIDIIPTVANLFGLTTLDYKAVFGTDALAIEEHIVRFADMSFVSENYNYDSLSEQYFILDDVVSPEYITSVNFRLMNEYRYNLLLLQYDYFYIEEEPE